MRTFLGYSNELHYKLKATYIIASVSFFLVFLFLLFYILLIPEPSLIIETFICLLNYVVVFMLLRQHKYTLAKALTVIGLLTQVALLVFIWFAPDTELQYFLFLVAPITFFIFDLDVKIERILIVIFNILSVSFTLVTTMVPNNEPGVVLSNQVVTIFKMMSVASVCISIFLVFYIYADTLRRVYHQLEELASTDSLTNISNRRVLFDHGDSLYNSKVHINKGFSFLLFDIDYFKSINDAYGHPVGDSILIQLTELIQSNIRHQDILARYGGEEFAVILKDVTPEEGVQIAEKIRKKIELHPFVINQHLTAKLTISIGVVTFDSRYDSFDDMVITADKALYKAKENGRNQVVIF